jgi:hypothetical protein
MSTRGHDLTPELTGRTPPGLDGPDHDAADPDEVDPAEPVEPVGDADRRLGRPGWRGPVTLLALAAVAAGFAAVQVRYFPLGRGPVYDEAVYLAQIRHGAPAVDFNAQRARGLLWLVLPVADASFRSLREYLLVIGAGLVVLGFGAWLRTLGWRVVPAAAGFCSLWLSLWYGTELFPNFPSALLSVAAAGFLAGHLARDTTDLPLLRTVDAHLVASAAALAAVTAIRPTEGTALAAGLGLGALSLRWRALLARAVLLGAGLAAGWSQWVVEAFDRFGGPANRLRMAADAMHSAWSPVDLVKHASLLDGGLVSAASAGPDPVPAAAWLAWAVLLAGALVVTVRAALRGPRGPLVAVLAAVTTLLPYLTTPIVEARFLLPSYALLCVAVAAALPPLPWAALPGPDRLRTALRPVLVLAWVALLLGGGWFARWQLHAARNVSAQQVVLRQTSTDLARDIRARSGTGACFFAAQYGFPEIALQSGCQGTPISAGAKRLTFRVPTQGRPVYAVTVTRPEKLAITPVPGSEEQLRRPGSSVVFWLFRVPDADIRVVPA